MASHGCGHFDGSTWSKADWRKEFSAFSHILRDAWEINGIDGEPAGWRSFVETEIRGFRAPYLATGKSLAPALVAAGFRYDASGVSRAPALPETKAGLVRFDLPQIPHGPSGRRIIAMDYNLFVRHSGGVDKPEEAAKYESRAYGAFRKAFDTQYAGGRVALQIGFHFTLMNDGAYWRALERFAGEVCVKADVECISYADYVGMRKDAAPVQTGG